MRLRSFALAGSIVLALTASGVAATRPHRGSISARKLAGHHGAKPKFQSQRAIDDGRATQIQAALIQAGYLTGTPTGHWDAASEAAMQKLQGDNGWQTKLVPDSRALIKLGLGPATAAANPLAAAPSSGAGTTETVAQR